MRERVSLSSLDISAVEDILFRGNTAEIKARKDDVIVLEVERHIRSSMPKEMKDEDVK